MKFTVITPFISSLLSLVAAVPAINSNTPSLEISNLPDEPVTPGAFPKRQNDFWGVEYCNAISFDLNEGCRKDFVNIYKCYNFPSGYLNSVSSLRVDKGIACSFYVGRDCAGYALLGVNYPIKDLRQYGGDSSVFNDNLESFLCWQTNC